MFCRRLPLLLSDINSLNKFPQSIGRKLVQVLVFVYPLDKLLQVFNLSFLHFNILLQGLDFHFKLLLLGFVASAHHGKSFIVDASRHIVLIDADKQAVKLSHAPLRLFQSLDACTDFFLAGQQELVFHNCPEVILIPCHIEDDRFHVHPDQIFQNNRPDEVSRTASRVASVVGAYKVILPLLKVIGGAVPHFCSAVGTVNHAGKQTALARFRPAVTLLPDLLSLVKDFLLDDCRMGVVENRLFVERRFPLLLVPDGIGVGLEIDGAARVFPPFQDVDNGVGIPMVGISGFRTWSLDADLPLICGGIQNLFLLQELGDLHRPPALHAQLEDTLHYHCRRFVHDPFCFVLRVFAIAKGNIGCQRYATLTLCFLHSPDFAAGVLGEKLVKPVFDAGNIAVCAVGVDGVKVVVDSDMPYSMLGEGEVDVVP